MKTPRRLPIIIGSGFAIVHSLWVVLLENVSRRNWEFERAWEAQYYFDLPMSLFFDPFYDFALFIFAKGPDASWFFFGHNFTFVFFLVAGGVQYFLWGWILGFITKRLHCESPVKEGDSTSRT